MNSNMDSPQTQGGSLKLPYKVAGGEPPVQIPEQMDPAGGSPNYLRIMHAALRGRYILVGALSVICAGLGGFAGWKHSKPVYTSEGLVQIHYFTGPTVRADNSGSEPLSMFDQYMAMQKTLITSRRVIDIAVKDPIWDEMGEAPPKNPGGYFTENMSVDIKSRSELIHLVVTDSDPGEAAAAVTSVINGYEKLYKSEEEHNKDLPLKVYNDNLTELRGQIADVDNKIHEKQQIFHTTKLDTSVAAAVDRENKLKAALNEVEIALAGARQGAASDKGNGDLEPVVVEITPEQIAVNDPLMRSYLDNEQALQRQITGLSTTGVGPNNSQMQLLLSQLSMVKTSIEDYATQWRTTHSTASALGTDTASRVNTMSVSDLQTHKIELSKMLAEAEAETTALSDANAEFQKLEAQLSDMKGEEAKLVSRADTLQDERTMGSRLQVISPGEVPISPTKDSRPKFAMAGAGLGAILPFAAAILLSMLIRRYRYADEAGSDSMLANIPMLGLLPEVRSKGEQPELMRATAHGVHHLRVLLTARKSGKHAYLITSAAEGEGKTSLAVALGMSFAATRRKTLLIDGDFVGQRMTRGFGMERQEGMFETVSDGNLAGRVKNVEANLDVLPTGHVGSDGAFGVTNESIQLLLEKARGTYDTIVVDSGPILGSLEASMLSQEVDGVILTISRGQQQSLLESAMRRLNSLNAQIAGVVFNRAKLKDFHYSTYASTAASTLAVPRAEETTERTHAYDRFGPIVRAVAQAAPAAA